MENILLNREYHRGHRGYTENTEVNYFSVPSVYPLCPL